MIQFSNSKNKKVNLLFSLVFTIVIIFLCNLFYKDQVSTQLMVDLKVPYDDKYQVFFDVGEGFNENDSSSINAKKDDNVQTLNFTLPANVKNLRIDVGTLAETVYLEKIVWKSVVRKHVWTPENIIEDFKIKNNIERTELVNNQLEIVSNGVDPFLVSENTTAISEYLSKDKFEMLFVYLAVFLIGGVIYFSLQVANINLKNKLDYVFSNFKIIMLCLFFMIIITIPMLSNSLGLISVMPGAEKRILAEKPTLNFRDGSYKNFVADYESYVKDNFGFRDKLIRYNNILKVKYLDVSPIDKVIIGKSGWLFYNAEGVINDFRGINHFNKEEIEKIKNNLNERKEWLEKRGIKFYITVAPNKHTIYSEYLPSNIDKYNQESRLDQLMTYLSKNSEVQIIDLRPRLMANKDQYILYKKNDTHWNSMGAFLAYDELAKVLEKDSIITTPVSLDNYSVVKETSGGDLANMLSMNDILVADQLKLIPKFESKVKDVEVDNNLYPNPSSLVVQENHSLVDHPKLLMFRDSFATDMVPFLSESFSRSVYIWDHNFNIDIIEKEKPDVVIYELVERNIQALLNDNPEDIKK